MKYIGIDPGKSGAIAVICEDGSIDTAVFDETAYVDILGKYAKDSFAVIEQVCGFSPPGARIGATSLFNFGANYGWIQGLLAAFRIPYQRVVPARWKKSYGLSRDKQKSIECALHLFPNANLMRTEKCKIPHDGIAEALLLAEYGRRITKNTYPINTLSIPYP